MRRGIKVRLLAFALLSAIGMVYVGASYLGFVDHVLGRGYTVHVLLPESGGLFKGSEVTYRGVKIGKVAEMTVEGDGLRVDAALKEDARVPANAPVFVHNLSAVGEQYLDFEPVSKQGRMLRNGDTVHGTKDTAPVGEDVLL
ncbi:MAG: MlaD family protein, partial [Aeromicrobium sp.]